MNYAGATWVSKVGAAQPEATTPLIVWAGESMRATFGTDILAKAGLGALLAAMSRIYESFGVLFWYCVLVWFADLILGILTVLADSETKFSSEKALRGVVKGLSIPVFFGLAAAVEGMLFGVTGYDPAGKFVATIGVAIFWSSAIEAARKAPEFWRELKLKIAGIDILRGAGRDDESDQTRRHDD